MKKTIHPLAEFDTPSLSNAIEKLDVRNRISGFCSREMKCLFPELGSMCGYAVTAEVETMSPETASLDDVFVDLCAAVELSPGPSVVVLHEVGPHPEFSAHGGEVMSTIFHRMGVVGMVSDGALRDVTEVREMGFHYFAPGMVASHANFRIVNIQVPVTVCGLRIEPGDLLHGDANGLISVPAEGRDKLPELVAEVHKLEKEVMDFAKSDSFAVEGLRRIFTH